MDTLVYEAIYRMENVYAKGYLILKDGYTECIFGKDYMAIYTENNIVVAELRALAVDILPDHSYKSNYISHHFNMSGKELFPGKSHYFFSIINSDTLRLDILEKTVEGNRAILISEILLPLTRLCSSS